jgi:ubiquinone/menaquinone biosynthesis C-methylase UbiE
MSQERDHSISSRNKESPALGSRHSTLGSLSRLVENDLIQRVSYDEYREKVKHVYGGPKGAMLATASMISLHIPLGRRLFRTRRFDLRGMKSILDVGSGAGQIVQHLLDFADADAQITGIDLSHAMLRRARQRLKTNRPRFVTADLSALPFADGSFDGVTCGYVLEHLPDARMGLTELARVLGRGGRMFLSVTEDTFAGAWTSRLWYCRTYNRRELMRLCESLGLRWKKELWFTRVHQAMRAGGICVEIEKV